MPKSTSDPDKYYSLGDDDEDPVGPAPEETPQGRLREEVPPVKAGTPVKTRSL